MSSGGGKGGGGGGSTTNDYYGDIAGIVCNGPVDTIHAIIADGKTIWKGPISRSGQPNPVSIPISGYGVAYFYWGTSNQTLATTSGGSLTVGGSTGVEDVLGPSGHPPYRRQAVLVLKAFLFGREKVSAPSIEVIVSRKPVQSVITGSAANLDGAGHANPLALLAELITDPVFGLGIPASKLDSESWQATAEELYDRRSEFYISPVIERSQTVRSLIDEIREYYDGWFRRTRDGRIAAGRFLRGEAPPSFTTETTITADDLLEEASIEAEGWADTANQVSIKYQDKANEYKDSSLTVTNGYSRNVVGEPRLTTIERKHITRTSQASLAAAEFLRTVGEPGLKGSLVIRSPRAVALQVGTPFLFTHDLLGLSVIARVVGRITSPPPAERVTIEFEAEKALPVVDADDGQETDPVTELDPPERIDLYQFFQPPKALFDEAIPRLCVLAARTKALTVGFNLHLQKADTSLFQRVNAQYRYAVKGLLNSNYSSALGTPDDNSESLSLTLDPTTLAVDLEIIGEIQSEDMIDDGNLLAIIFSVANPSNFEILAVRAGRISSGNYLLKVRRGQFGTGRRTFAADDVCWIIHREKITEFAHASFPSFADNSTTAKFRLQSFTNYAEADLSDTDICPDINFTFSPVDYSSNGKDDYVVPDEVTGVDIQPGFNSAIVSWVLPTNVVVARTLIYENNVPILPSEPSAVTPAPGVYQWFVGIPTPATRYYWIQVQSKAGHYSAISGPFDVSIQGVNVTDFAEGLTPVEIVTALPSVGNFKGRTVVLTTDSKLYRWTNAGVTTGTTYWSRDVDGADVVAGTIQAGAISAGAITADKIGTNQVITSAANIGNAVITGAKIANATIATANIVDAAITNAKIGNAAVDTAQIANLAVTNGKIENLAVTSGKIADASITNAKIGSAAVDTAQIATAAITTAKIDSLQVTTVKIGNQAVTIPVDNYTSGGVTINSTSYTQIQSVSITSSGAPISISASATMKMGSGSATMDFRLLRDGSSIYTATEMDYDLAALIAFTVQDTPGSGSTTYSLEARLSPGFSSGSRVAANRSLVLIETKK
jgi:hypothetical protein